jgi:hypothetical protein
MGAPMHVLNPVSGVAGIAKLSAQNWSGYADVGTAGSFTRVTSKWVQPSAKCGSSLTIAAFWVGIDGVSSADPTVQQDGTIVECVGGTPVYADWWETYPGNAVQIEHPVSPGDHMTATVSYSAGSYSMSVVDSTNPAASFSVSEPCGATSCQNMSAEWIAEAPCCQNATTLYPLADFGTWSTSGAKSVYKGHLVPITGVPTVDEITMVDSANSVKASPSSLNSTGTAFKVRWVRST